MSPIMRLPESSRLSSFPFSYHYLSRTYPNILPLTPMISTRLAAPLRLRLGRRLYSSNPTTPAASTEAKRQAVVPQSPNRAVTWSTSQSPRPAGQSGPRFEQTIMELQPNPLSAMELLANEPVHLVHGRKAICDGGKPTPAPRL
jgi:NADH dehydrogenase (ubiquinone) Fe-S protein 6